MEFHVMYQQYLLLKSTSVIDVIVTWSLNSKSDECFVQIIITSSMLLPIEVWIGTTDLVTDLATDLATDLVSGLASGLATDLATDLVTDLATWSWTWMSWRQNVNRWNLIQQTWRESKEIRTHLENKENINLYHQHQI